jgi:hypothetical protein
LSAYRSLHTLPPAHPQHLENLRGWLTNKDGGHGFLHGVEASLYNGSVDHDLVSLTSKNDQPDAVTEIINKYVLPWCHQRYCYDRRQPVSLSNPFTGEQQPTRIYWYSDRKILFVANAVSTVLASMIPSLCTLILFYIRSPIGRMGALVAFTLLFSMTLSLVTNVTRAECFGITAAFSAVLVVFVGNSIGQN